MQADRHTRWVSWLKILFPLAALAILSTLFLLSRRIDPETVIPFADKEIQDRLRDQQVTGPFFAGATAYGDLISFSAEKLTTPQGQTGSNEALDVMVKVRLASGAELAVQAAMAQFDVASDLASLSGDVVLTTSTGYRILSDLLDAEMTEVNLRSPGQVDASGPAGTLRAGSMEIATPEDGSAPQLIFTNGVKLVYSPKQEEE